MVLKELCLLRGVSGDEDRVRDFVRAHAEKYADSVAIDRMGNLLAFKKGTDSHKHVMLAAHMDEVGFIVDRIVNFTNVCTAACAFCAYHARAGLIEPYRMTIDEVLGKVDELARAASDTLTLIEVNNSSLRAGSYRMNTHANMAKMLRACERHGVFVSLVSDAHFATAVGRFGEALQLLSELDFPEELVASTSLDKFRALIGRKA